MVDAQDLQFTQTLRKIPFSIEFAQELLRNYGSPLYVYQEDILNSTIDYITQAISYPRTQFHFASVTNGNVALLQIFQQLGWGLHANTPGDIYLGLQAGFAPYQIVYSGSNLSRAEMEQVLKWGVRTLNLDSLAQLQLFCEVYQQLKVVEGRQDAHPTKTVKLDAYEFGFTKKDENPSSPHPTPYTLLSSQVGTNKRKYVSKC